jgi:hypothetical protein
MEDLEIYILGAPFFEKYYTIFSFPEKGEGSVVISEKIKKLSSKQTKDC